MSAVYFCTSISQVFSRLNDADAVDANLLSDYDCFLIIGRSHFTYDKDGWNCDLDLDFTNFVVSYYEGDSDNVVLACKDRVECVAPF